MKDKILNFIMVILLALLIVEAMFKTSSKEFQNQVYREINNIKVEYFNIDVQDYHFAMDTNFNSQKEKVKFKPYIQKLQNNIKSNWKPPFGILNKKVVLMLRIAKNGQLDELTILTPLDAETTIPAIEAVNATTPFYPLPEEFKGKSINIQLIFEYNIINKISYNF